MEKMHVNIKKVIYYSILTLEVILYAIFMSIDIGRASIDTTWFKYSGMLLLLVLSFLNIRDWDKKHIFFRIAFISTLFADMFLLVINSYYEIGLIFFLITQISYYIYLMEGKGKKSYLISLFGYFIAICSGIIVLNSFKMVEIANILALFYFIMLVLNFIICIINTSKNAINAVSAIGFGLFICCDICVGLNNLDVIYNNESLIYFVSFAMWMFYLPSQFLIVSSLDKLYLKEEN